MSYKKNIKYKSKEIRDFYSSYRNKWPDLYKSERKVIDRLKINKKSKILDIGSACGGLGKILYKRFKVDYYLGLEVNKSASNFSKNIFSKGNFKNLDFLNFEKKKLRPTEFDYVFSLGCIDWNVEFDRMLKKAWKHVKIDGYLVLTLRFTNRRLKGKYFQFINFSKELKGDKANYHILNFKKFKKKIKNFNIKKIIQYGYWKAPSPTAMVPFKKLYFTGVALQKGEEKKTNIKKFF